MPCPQRLTSASKIPPLLQWCLGHQWSYIPDTLRSEFECWKNNKHLMEEIPHQLMRCRSCLFVPLSTGFSVGVAGLLPSTVNMTKDMDSNMDPVKQKLVPLLQSEHDTLTLTGMVQSQWAPSCISIRPSEDSDILLTQQSKVDKLPNQKKQQQTIHISCHHALQMKKCIDIGFCFYCVEYNQQEKCDWIPSTRAPGSMSVNGNCWEIPPKTAYLGDLTSCHQSLYSTAKKEG